jgi:hypothetical protein
VQTVSQHTPSAQCPERQARLSEHAFPFAPFALQLVPSQ